MVMRCVHPRPWLLPHPHWGTFVMHRSCRVYLAMPDLDRRHAGCAGRHPSCIALGASPCLSFTAMHGRVHKYRNKRATLRLICVTFEVFT